MLITIGTIVYFSRKMGSMGGSGKGVSHNIFLCQLYHYHSFFLLFTILSFVQGLFGVGQSTAKMINKETNIRTKFR